MLNQYQKYPIIMLSMSRWDSHISSASYCLAKELSKRQKVYYIDMPYTVKDFLVGFFRPHIKKRLLAFFLKSRSLITCTEISSNFFVIVPCLVFPINWIRPGRLYNFLFKLNDQLFSRSVFHAIRKEKISEFILFNSFNPFYGWKLIEHLKPHLFIYQSRDDISTLLYVKRHGPDKEIQMIKKADLNIATSITLANKLSELSGKNVKILNNGVELDIFLNLDGIAVKPNTVFYSGNIDQRLDFRLIRNLLDRFPDFQFIFVGPISSEELYSYGLHQFPNLVLKGSLSKKEMAHILNESELAIIPFLINEQTASIYPLKINEYLACGKPVVTTNFSRDLEEFKDVASIVDTEDEFFDAIKNFRDGESEQIRERRIQLSINNSWMNRVNQLDGIIEEYIG